ncbi:leucine-rich repeat domain-containing protein [Hymenobacter sp. BT523]|uniref:leucine-rich repeat domain-containing protein n=1 Tax=Hymenobacter sp. BT523 TaxID=2795725 RepID=UPI0018ECD1C9|nr:leucine-rich repeat domain-containing protein [Hymenobacter sp. BT523]MBJ6110404.1 leucine-rich repeat domain-containing protein [Hymenobacter sp. BT523]
MKTTFTDSLFRKNWTMLCAVAGLHLMGGQLLRAQDIIYKAAGDSIVSSVDEVNDDEVLYFNVPTTKGSVRRKLSVKEVSKIKYANGYVELFESTTLSSGRTVTSALAFDVIYTVSGSELKAKVLEVDESSVTYSLLNSKTVDKIATDRLIGIRYANGYEEAYNAPAALKQKAAAQALAAASQKASAVLNPDVIKLDNGKEIKARIQEVDELNIYFTPFDGDAGKREAIALEKVFKVMYANGYEETYAVSKKALAKEEAAEEPEAKPSKAPEPKPAKVVEAKPAKVAEPKPEKEKIAKAAPKRAEPAEKKPAVAAAPLAPQELAVIRLTDVLKKEPITSLQKAAFEPMSVEYLDLRSNNLKALPAEVKNFKNLVAINLSKNNLRKFPVELLDLPNLQYVWLDETGLQSLSFEGEPLEKLKKSHIVFISAKSNRLTRVSSSVFGLGNLQELKLNNNQISGITWDKKTDLSQSYLQSIDFQSNRLSSLPVELKDLPSLTELSLSNNNIKSLDKETAGFKTLKSLKLNSNPLKKITPQFYQLSAIEEVDLNQTQLTSLPDSVSKLSRLKVLVLPGTFATFPADFGRLKLLTELRLNNSTPYSKIQQFPAAVLSCQRLRTLDLSGADIKALPGEIAKLKRLENLYLSNCRLSTLPEELFTLPRLKVLDLSNNKITQVSKSVAELNSLENLNLTDSPVEGASLLSLRRSLPSAQIEYFDDDFGLNFTSAPLPANKLSNFKRLFAACDQGSPAAYVELGDFFNSSKDYGLAVKAYRVVAENPRLAGTGKSMACLLSIAEIYDDVDNVKPYTSPYKRKRYADYDDYLNTSANNKAFQSYLAITKVNPLDPVARQAQKKASARASIICNEIAENLEKIFERNTAEIERLIQGSGDMQNLSAGGEKIMNDAVVDNSEAGAAVGAVLSIFGSVAATAKEDKSEKYKSQNVRLKSDISSLKAQATQLAAN